MEGASDEVTDGECSQGSGPVLTSGEVADGECSKGAGPNRT